MTCQIRFKPIMCCLLLVLMLPLTSIWAQAPSGRGGGAYGDYQIKYKVREREMTSILSFSRDGEGNRTAQWISFTRVSEVKDLKVEDGKISFSRESRNRDGETTISTFTGTIADRKLTGTMSSDRGEYTIEGAPMPRMPRAVGSWAMTIKLEDRETNLTLVVKADKEGKLTALWKRELGDLEIPDVQYERGTLRFKVERKREDRQWTANFEGRIQRDGTLAGVITSDRGEMKIEGKRIGAPLIGTWNLESVSERGTYKGRLKVNPDMSGLYGATPIEKVTLEDNKVSLKIVLSFGDQTREMNFAGKVEDAKLSGEMTASWGSSKVTGTKVVRTSRGRPSR